MQPGGFDSRTGTISALAAIDTPYWWIMTVALLVTGLCHLVTAAALGEARAPGRIVFAVAGLATALVALIPLPTTDHGGPAAPCHGIVAAVSFAGLALWPALARNPDAGNPALRGAVPFAASAVLLSLVVVFYAGISLAAATLPAGSTERVAAGAEALWPLVVVIAAQVTVGGAGRRPNNHDE
jgi:hypothetical membrane protein